MSGRAILLGFLLAATITLVTYLNNNALGGTLLTGNHLPVAVFGVLVVVVLFVNPLLGVVRGKVLSAGELTVACALGLAACAWPDSNWMRYFAAVATVGPHAEQALPSWQAVEVLSYVPGGSARLAEGYVTDWQALGEALSVMEGCSEEPDRALLARVWSRLGLGDRALLGRLASGEAPSREERWAILSAINALLSDPRLFDDEGPDGGRPRAEVEADNRARLVALAPEAVHPQPRGDGVLLNRADPHTPAVDGLLTGAPPGERLTPMDVPWRTWWPVLRLWGGLALLMGLASLCLMVVVHPQWSRHEMLPYPVARFAQELAAPLPGETSGVARLARSRLFWLGLAGVVGLHAVNGVHVWFDFPVEITRQFDFLPLKALFPNASRDAKVNYLFAPILYPSVIGFGYFLSTRVTLSLGLALPLWLLVAGTLMANGVQIMDGRFVIDANRPAIRYGAFIGAAAMILYYGRRYYLRVAAGAVGWRGLVGDGSTIRGCGERRFPGVPRSAVWGARLAGLCYFLAVALLAHYGGLSVAMAGVILGMVLVSMLVVTRVHVETGMFFMQPEFLPGTVLAAAVGFGGLGPEAYLVAMLASVMLFADPRATLMPFVANGLKLGESVAGVGAARLSPWLGGVVALGLAGSVIVGLTVQYNLGFNPLDTHPNRFLPTAAFEQAARALVDLSAVGGVAEVTGRSGLVDTLWHAEPSWNPLAFALAGAGLYVGCAVARVRLPWWPLHPVIFLVWGSLASSLFAVSFLVSAAIKSAAVRGGGERGYQLLLPLMVGLIAGDLLSALGWTLAGVGYYAVMGLPPPTYQVLP